MAHNKIVLVTIHQPTSKIFQMFSKAALLDKGGRLVFFGTPHEMLEYFAEAEHETHFGTELGGCPACGTTRPEFIFDVLETPLRDLSGDIIFEENSQGQLVPARRFSPEYWRDKYESHRLLQEMKHVPVRKQPPAPVPVATRKRAPVRFRDEWTQMQTLLRRAFLSKLRNHGNLRTTIFGAPALAALTAGVLHYAGTGAYDFASAYHIATYLFVALVVAMFLGLTNSADDIIRDRTILQRERNLNVRLPYYIFAKSLTLAVFAAVQCTLFVLIGNAILEIRGMFWIYTEFMFITSFSGITIGLFVSSIVADAKTAANIVPLVLIPNIILGGALIKYEEMNRNLDLKYVVDRYFTTHTGKGMPKRESDLKVPLICEFVPMRWSYEALVVAQAKLNPLTSRQEEIQAEIDDIVKIDNRSKEQADRLEDLKDTLAMLSGLEADSVEDIEKRLHKVDHVIGGKPLDPQVLKTRYTGLTAERLYVNQKITDMVSKAETEQADYRRQTAEKLNEKPPYINVFFGPQKRLTRDLRCSVLLFNTMVLVVFSGFMLGLLYFSLKRQLRIIGHSPKQQPQAARS
jgi:hypothetical protein